MEVQAKVFKNKEEAEVLIAGHDDLLHWQDPPGAKYSPHTHAHEENIYILEGSMTFTVVHTVSAPSNLTSCSR